MVVNRAALRKDAGRPPAIQMASGGCAQKARHRCRPNTLSMTEMDKLISLGEGPGRLKPITFETGEPASNTVHETQSPTGYAWRLIVDEDDAGPNDDDNPSPEDVDAQPRARPSRTMSSRTSGVEEKSSESHESEAEGDPVLTKNVEEKTGQPETVAVDVAKPNA